MNASQFLIQFDRISGSPDAIQRLRRFVLDLAVRGRLVPQDPEDEPASALIKRIRAEKAGLMNGPRTKKSTALPPKETESEPYSIPPSWKWVTLGEAVNRHLGGGTPSKGNSSYWDGEIRWASVKDVGKGRYIDDTIDRISEAGLANSSSNLIPPGNLIVVTRMGLGKVSINRVPLAINQDLRALFVSSLVAIDYYYIFLMTHGFEGTGLTVKGIKLEELFAIPFPLPPLAEQHRIVTRVNELMTLCGRLEAAHAEREHRRDRLTAASLNRLSQLAGADETTFQESARFLLSHVPQVTSRPDQIQQLRQTILDLAIRGNLGQQDPKDEPASELVKRIRLERARLVEEGEAKDQKLQSANEVAAEPFGIPQNWQWVSLGDLAFGFRYGTSVKCSYEQNGEPVLRIPNVARGIIDVLDLKYGQLSAREAEDLRLQLGDILIVRSNGSLNLVGRPALVEAHAVGFCYAGYLVRVRTSVDYLNTRYLLLALNTDHVRSQIEIPIRTTVGLKNVNATELSNLRIPLPPLSEQHRIVATVNKLMNVCDQLEVQLTTARTESSLLLETVLHKALTPRLLEAS